MNYIIVCLNNTNVFSSSKLSCDCKNHKANQILGLQQLGSHYRNTKQHPLAPQVHSAFKQYENKVVTPFSIFPVFFCCLLPLFVPLQIKQSMRWSPASRPNKQRRPRPPPRWLWPPSVRFSILSAAD